MLCTWNSDDDSKCRRAYFSINNQRNWSGLSLLIVLSICILLHCGSILMNFFYSVHSLDFYSKSVCLSHFIMQVHVSVPLSLHKRTHKFLFLNHEFLIYWKAGEISTQMCHGHGHGHGIFILAVYSKGKWTTMSCWLSFRAIELA